MTKCTEALRLLEEFVRCKDVRRLDKLVGEARAFLAQDTTCDAEKAALVETQQERNAAVESYEGMRHSWYTEHNALLEAQGKLEAIAALARQGQYVWVSALDRILRGTEEAS